MDALGPAEPAAAERRAAARGARRPAPRCRRAAGPGITIPPNVALPGVPPPSAHPPSQPPGPTQRPQVETARRRDPGQYRAHADAHADGADAAARPDPRPGDDDRSARRRRCRRRGRRSRRPSSIRRSRPGVTALCLRRCRRPVVRAPTPARRNGRPRGRRRCRRRCRRTVVRRRWPRQPQPRAGAQPPGAARRAAAIPGREDGRQPGRSDHRRRRRRARRRRRGGMAVRAEGQACRRRSDPGRGQRRGRRRRSPRSRRRSPTPPPPAPVAAAVPRRDHSTAATDARKARPFRRRSRSVGDRRPAGDRAHGESPAVVPDAAKPVPPPRRGPVPTTARSDVPTDPVARPSTAAVATDRTVPAPTTASASAAKPRPSRPGGAARHHDRGQHRRTGDDDPAARARLDLRHSLRHARHQHRLRRHLRTVAADRPAGAARRAGARPSRSLRSDQRPRRRERRSIDPHATSARESCGKRVFVALAICMDERCEDPRWRNSEECIPILARKRQRAGGRPFDPAPGALAAGRRAGADAGWLRGQEVAAGLYLGPSPQPSSGALLALIAQFLRGARRPAAPAHLAQAPAARSWWCRETSLWFNLEVAATRYPGQGRRTSSSAAA